MAKKIATAEAVFRACEELDAAGHPWNRDDVRYRVGGGGFNVIDPLIQAWRRLKPLKAIAPNTPTELLHMVATSLEQHLTLHLAQFEQNTRSQAKAFNLASADLTSEIETLNDQVLSLTRAQEESTAHIQALTEQRELTLQEMSHLKAQHKSLQDENDSLRGQIQRIEQHGKTLLLEQEQKYNALAEKHQCDLNDIAKKHTQDSVQQQNAWREAQEATENRLMRLLDKERNEHKAQMAVVLDEKQALKDQLNEQQQQLLSLHKDLAQKDEKISALRDEKKSLLRDGKKDDTLAEIQAAIKGLQDRISAETS